MNMPEHWEVIPLENAVNIFDKQRIPLNEAHRQQMPGEYPYCGANGIVDHVNDYLFDGEYILLAEDGGYWGSLENSAYLMRGKFWVNNHAHVLQAKQGLSHNYFLTFQLNYLDIKPFISGTTRGKLNQGMMKRVPLTLPPLPEQRTIAHILQTIQEAKFTRKREIELEQERKAALMDFLFTHGAKGEPRKQTEIGEIPESWEMVKLGEIADIVYGVQAAVAKLLDESIGLPILTNINITLEGTLDLTKLRYYELPENKREKLILRKGDLLFNWRSGSQHHVGKTALFDKDEEYTFSSFILRFRLSDQIDNIFALNYFHYLRTKRYFEKKRSQSSINSVMNASRSADIPMLVPSINEQLKIGDTLQKLNVKIAALEREVELIVELFHTMLEELMTGQRSAVPLIDTKLLN